MPDTIVALATPAGRSGIGVIRLSGAESLNIVGKLTQQKEFVPKPRFAHLKKIYDIKSGEILDEAIILFFKSPHSFTGEDIIEISCHGSPVVLRKIIDSCLVLNARLADPGEFSLRALTNGRINLSQAEAIRDLINSQTLSAVKQSFRQLSGEVSNHLQPIKDELLKIIVILESALEFVEDDLPDFQYEQIENSLKFISEKISKFSSTYQSGKLLREGLSVVIAGRPNVGKSSVFNALVGQERSIVTDIPGTTRDHIGENISINDIPVSLLDTAGLRQTDDYVEGIGVERAKRAMFDADLVIVLFDGSQKLNQADFSVINDTEKLSRLFVVNKTDLDFKALNFDLSKAVNISAKTGEGFDDLKSEIIKPFLSSSLDSSGFLVSDARHYDLLLRAANEVETSKNLMHQRMSEEIVLIGLHNALSYLGQITGETTTEDLLTQVFSTFCIGK